MTGPICGILWAGNAFQVPNSMKNFFNQLRDQDRLKKEPDIWNQYVISDRHAKY